MENPNYAKWIPEAGGYVHNGAIVSKNPIYDMTGRQQAEVELSQLSNAKPTVSADVTGNVDLYNPNVPIGGAFGGSNMNKANSGEDVNEAITKIGSMGSTTNNTATTGSSISTPVINSPVAGETEALNPIDDAIKNYQYMVETGNLKGQIDWLTKLGQLQNADYSQEINELWKQRSEKIKNQDAQYTRAISQAMAQGDTETANQLAQEQQSYRDNVDYYDQIGRDYQIAQQSIEADYVPTYLQGVNDIANAVLSQLTNVINFQYNPATDLRLQVAQGYAVGAVKEQMNHTGMYYSSMTQNAIARATAELVPVYEQMAREELIENINLFQNTASFLMNLEQTQFNLWKGQIGIKLELAQEERAKVKQAIETANARGYYTNEEAILLGVPAGTESYEARTRAQNKQDQIEAELRQYEIGLRTAEYKAEMEKEKAWYENELKKDYWAFQVNNPKPSNSDDDTKLGGTMKVDDLIEYYKDLDKAGYDTATIDQMLYDASYSREDYMRATTRINNGDTATGKKSHNLSDAEVIKIIEEEANSGKVGEALDDAIKYAEGDASKLDYYLTTAKYAEDDEKELSEKNIFDKDILNALGKNAYKEYLNHYYKNDGDMNSMLDNASDLVQAIVSNSNIDTPETYEALARINVDVVQKAIENAETSYGEKSDLTYEAVNKAFDSITTYCEAVNDASKISQDLKNEIIVDAYTRLMDSVANSKEDFDYNWVFGNTGIKSRTEAIANIVSKVRDNSSFGKDQNDKVYNNVLIASNNLQGMGKINELSSAWGAGM